jgi:hypothetical protein
MGGKLERRERTRKNTGEKEAEEWDIMVFTFIVEQRILLANGIACYNFAFHRAVPFHTGEVSNSITYMVTAN